jgi:hypothetical protein
MWRKSGVERLQELTELDGLGPLFQKLVALEAQRMLSME